MIVGKNQNNNWGSSFKTGILCTFTTKVAVTIPMYEPASPPIWEPNQFFHFFLAAK